MNCEFCIEEINEEAKICPHCHSLLKEYKICPRCAERIQRNAAVCRYCNFDIQNYERQQRIQAGEEKSSELLIEVAASPIGALFSDGSLTSLLFPPELKISQREVVIKKWSLLGLRTTNQTISIMKIASVRFIKGVIWGGIIFESYGGGIPDLVINGLYKEEALSVVKSLEKILSKISFEQKK